MEDILAVYTQPADPKRPLVCMDEVPKQLLSDVRDPISAQPGRLKRFDYEYKRKGVANLFMFFEPFRGQRHIKVTDRRTRLDWAEVVLRAFSRSTTYQGNRSPHSLGLG